MSTARVRSRIRGTCFLENVEKIGMFKNLFVFMGYDSFYFCSILCFYNFGIFNTLWIIGSENVRNQSNVAHVASSPRSNPEQAPGRRYLELLQNPETPEAVQHPQQESQPVFVSHLGQGGFGRVDKMQIPGKGFFARKIFQSEEIAKQEYNNFYNIRCFRLHPNIIKYLVSLREKNVIC